MEFGEHGVVIRDVLHRVIVEHKLVLVFVMGNVMEEYRVQDHRLKQEPVTVMSLAQVTTNSDMNVFPSFYSTLYSHLCIS